MGKRLQYPVELVLLGLHVGLLQREGERLLRGICLASLCVLALRAGERPLGPSTLVPKNSFLVHFKNDLPISEFCTPREQGVSLW